MKPSGTVLGAFAVETSGVRGYAYDSADLARRLAVELLVDGWPVDLARADDFAPEAASVGDGCYGFGFRLPDTVLDGGGTIEVRVANTGEPVGDVASAAASAIVPVGTVGRVTWAGGLRLTGWIEAPTSGEAASIKLLVACRTVVETEARGFVALRQGMLRRPKARFDVHLPAAYADGRVHRIVAVDGRGRELTGSPCLVLAFPDGIRDVLVKASALVDGDPRVTFVESLLPRSVPFTEVEAWISRHPPPDLPASGRDLKVGILLLGDDVQDTLGSLDGQSLRSWLALSVPRTEGAGTFDPFAIRQVLDAEAELDVVLVAPAGARFGPRALERLATLAMEAGAPAYADAWLRTHRGTVPLLWPSFDPERQLEQGYAAIAFAAPAAAVSSALDHGASSSFALFDAIAEHAVPVHLPELLVDLPSLDPGLGIALAAVSRRRAGGTATIMAPDRGTGLPCVSVRRPRQGQAAAVAVIQPEPWLPDLARLSSKFPDAAERLVVSHRPLPMAAGWRNVVVAGGRNPSLLRSAAIDAVQSRRLLFLDAGVEPEGEDALAELADRLVGDTVAVGGLLLDEEGLVASAGLVLGPGFGWIPAFADLPPETGGYAGALSVARSCGALDPAAWLVDRAAAANVGGFDAVLFPERCGGADLCLRLRAEGGRLVVSPRARFVRHRAWRDRTPDLGAAAELSAFWDRWGKDLAADPFYHPSLNFDAAPFTALAWPPRPRSPRRPAPQRMRPLDPEVP